ncbi:MAG: BrnT family toxin [Saprospiraceae bacterium]
MPNFEWDENKNGKNKVKHNISFENAKKVFEDDKRLQYAVDRNGERRYITIGKALKVIITVVYTLRNFAFRLISARPARKDERERYITNSLTKQDDEYDKE